MQSKTFVAKRENLLEINAFLEGILEGYNFDIKKQMQLAIAVEELFTNVADYAYGDKEGDVEVKVGLDDDGYVFISIINGGVQFNPWEKEDPDVNLPPEDRQIGGLGIYMVKQNIDKYDYEYKDGKNIVTIYKK